MCLVDFISNFSLFSLPPPPHQSIVQKEVSMILKHQSHHFLPRFKHSSGLPGALTYKALPELAPTLPPWSPAFSLHPPLTCQAPSHLCLCSHTTLCLECSPPRSQFKCHLLIEAFPTQLVKSSHSLLSAWLLLLKNIIFLKNCPLCLSPSATRIKAPQEQGADFPYSSF